MRWMMMVRHTQRLKELRYNRNMEEKMFDRVDGLVNQKWVDEMVTTAYHVAYDAMVCEPFEVDDVLDYIDTVIRERVSAKIAKEL